MYDIDSMLIRLNELEILIEENIDYAEEVCADEGYPIHGSNFELMVESFNLPLEKEQAELLEQDYNDLICYQNGKWVKR